MIKTRARRNQRKNRVNTGNFDGTTPRGVLSSITIVPGRIRHYLFALCRFDVSASV